MRSLEAQLQSGLDEFESLERELNTSYNAPTPVYAADTRRLGAKLHKLGSRDVKNDVRKALAASLGFDDRGPSVPTYKADTSRLDKRLGSLGSRNVKTDVRSALQNAFGGGVSGAKSVNKRGSLPTYKADTSRLDSRLGSLGTRNVKTDVRTALQNAFGGGNLNQPKADTSRLDARLGALGTRNAKADVRAALQNAFGGEDSSPLFQPRTPPRAGVKNIFETPGKKEVAPSYKADTSGLQARLDRLGGRDAKSDVRNALQNAFGGEELPSPRQAFRDRGYKVSGAYQRNPSRSEPSKNLQETVARYTAKTANRARSDSSSRKSRSPGVIRGRSPHRASNRRARAAEARSRYNRARSEERSRLGTNPRNNSKNVYSNRRASAYSERGVSSEKKQEPEPFRRSHSTPKSMKSPGKKSVTFDESPEVLLHGMPSGPPGRSRPARVYGSRSNRSTTPERNINKRINLDTIQKVKKSLQMLGRRGGSTSFSPYGHNKFYKNLSTVPVPARAGQRRAQKSISFKWSLNPRDCKTLSRDGVLQSVPISLGDQRFQILVEYDNRNYNTAIRVILILDTNMQGIQSVNISTLNGKGDPILQEYDVSMRSAYQKELELYNIRQNHPSFRALEDELLSGELTFEVKLSVDKTDFSTPGGAPTARISAPLMFQTGRLSDFTLTFHTRKWNVHRCILATQSGFFKRLFDQQPAETYEGTHEIEVAKSDVEAEAFVEFLYNETHPENVSMKALVQLANHYEVKSLQEVILLNQTDQTKREVAQQLLDKLRVMDSDVAKDVSVRLLALIDTHPET